MIELFQKIFPDFSWDPYLFGKLPNNFLPKLSENLSDQENFVKFLKNYFNIKNTSDWYSVNSNQLSQVISLKISQVMKIVKKFYPDLDLKKFEQSKNRNPIGFWNKIENHLEFLNQFSDKLKIKSIEDWYNLSIMVRFTKSIIFR